MSEPLPGMVPRTPVVSLRDVGRTFPGAVPVHALAHLTLTIDVGEYVAVTGPSGAGKSTLMNIIGLLDVPTAGSYESDGKPTTHLTDDQRSALRGRRIGFVFQDFHGLDHLTATENVAMGQLYAGIQRQQRLVRAREVLARVGLAHRADAEPAALSGGERQRVAIARALAGNPSILLCDEPTGSLDTENTLRILDLFDRLNASGLTLLVVTHDPLTASRARRRITIIDGTLHADEDASHD